MVSMREKRISPSWRYKVTKFLSNKYNLWGIIFLCNILIGYIIAPYLTVQQWWVVFLLILCNNFCVMTYGMAQGMLMLSLTQTAFKKFLDNIKKEKNNDTE